jgi:hypothetical protein
VALGRRVQGQGNVNEGTVAAQPAAVHAGIVIEPLRRSGSDADHRAQAPASIAPTGLPTTLPPAASPASGRRRHVGAASRAISKVHGKRSTVVTKVADATASTKRPATKVTKKRARTDARRPAGTR